VAASACQLRPLRIVCRARCGHAPPGGRQRGGVVATLHPPAWRRRAVANASARARCGASTRHEQPPCRRPPPPRGNYSRAVPRENRRQPSIVITRPLAWWAHDSPKVRRSGWRVCTPRDHHAGCRRTSPIACCLRSSSAVRSTTVRRRLLIAISVTAPIFSTRLLAGWRARRGRSRRPPPLRLSLPADWKQLRR